MTAPTPLWLCLKIEPQKERKAHDVFCAHKVVALEPPTETVRFNRHGKRMSRERILLPGYAFVAHDGEPDFDARLLRLQFPADETPFRAIRGQNAGEIEDIVRNPFQIVERPIVHRILGRVPIAHIEQLAGELGRIAARQFRPNDKARLMVAGDYREVQIAVVKGRKVRVIIDGREVTTTVDRLEAA